MFSRLEVDTGVNEMTDLTYMIAAIWIGAGLGTAYSKDSSCMGAAVLGTVVVCIAYSPISVS